MSPQMTLVSQAGLVDLALKSAAIMLLALLATALLSRASAGWRHFVWCLSVASLLLLPVLSLALPAWQVAWLPWWNVEPTQLAIIGETSQTDHREPVVSAPPTVIVEVPSVSATTTDTDSLPAANLETTNSPRIPVPSWLACVWMAGSLLSLVPLAIGLWQLAVLQRRSQVIDDQRWLVQLADLRRQLTVRRSVQLRQSAAPLPPLTWGALRPVVIVPDEASSWSHERRRLVLLHELAHVRRWDWLTQLVAHFACAAYWFNPLVWLAARQMRIERERACDDLVLACGARASDYAQELVALAAGLTNSGLSTIVTVPMARPGMLEVRLRGILDSRRPRAAITTAAACLGAALAAAAIAPLAMLRAAPPELAKSETKEPKQEPPVKTRPAAEKPVEKPAAKTVTIRGKVLDDATGEPIGKLITQAGKFDPADPKKVTWGYSEGRSSARDGSFSTTIRWTDGWTARILADGYIPQPVIASAPPGDKDEIDVVIRLKRGPKVRGVVLDHSGKPVKDAAIFAIGPTGVNLSGGQARTGIGGTDDETQHVRTDADGRFELPIGEAKSLAVSHAALDAWPAEIPTTGEVTIRLPEPARVDVELAIDGADKEGIIFYQLLTEGRKEFSGLRLERDVNIANPGKLSLAALPPGRYQLCRSVMNNLGEIGIGAMLEREFFELRAGETKAISFVRDRGVRIRGKATPPTDTKLMGTIISVRSLLDQMSPFDNHEWPVVYASQTVAEDGSFQTERILPGKYLLVAESYTPLTREQRFRTGRISPSHRAQVTIDVPAEGDLKVDDLVLQPIPAGN